MAALVARDIPAGSYVNLGIGQPTKVADYLKPDSGVVLHTENGMLGMGPAAAGRRDRHRPHQRRQGPGHRAARGVVLPPRRLVRDDARRPPRRLRPRRLPGLRPRRPRQLAHRRTRRDPRRRRRDGPRHRRQAGLRDDVAVRQGRRRRSWCPSAPTRSPALDCVNRVYTDVATFHVTPDGVAVAETFGISFDDLAERLDVPLVRWPTDRVAVVSRRCCAPSSTTDSRWLRRLRSNRLETTRARALDERSSNARAPPGRSAQR